MSHPDIHAALGRERQKTLLADAEAARTARQARLHRRQAAIKVQRDAPLLAHRFTWLSAAARGLRLLRPEDEPAAG